MINNMTAELKLKINSQAKNYIENMDENSDILDLKEKTKTIVLNVLYKYFVMTPDDDIKFDKEAEIKCGDVISVILNKKKAKLVAGSAEKFYNALRSKLNWSGVPHA